MACLRRLKRAPGATAARLAACHRRDILMAGRIDLGELMAYFEMPAGGSGGGPHAPWCTKCRAPIAAGQRSVRITFDNDPHGHGGLSGVYHEQCGKNAAALARFVGMNWLGKF